MTTAYLLNYAAHLGTAFVLLALFMFVYQCITPYNEVALIRAGNTAAALSYGGAVLGFSFTLVSAIVTSAAWLAFVGWAAAAGVVQILTFVALSFLFKQVKSHIEEGNTAMGAAIGSISLATGLLNAACLS